MSKTFPVNIERSADGAYRLHWDASDFAGPVRVRVHTDASRAPHAEPVLASAESGVRLDLPAGQRHYFHLEPSVGDALTAAQRDVNLQGGTNFRGCQHLHGKRFGVTN